MHRTVPLNQSSVTLPDWLKAEFSHDELAELKLQFDALDASGDGSLDPDELMHVMISLDIDIQMDHVRPNVHRRLNHPVAASHSRS